MITWTHERMNYVWEPAPYTLTSLYGVPLVAGSDVPDGMTMTLRNGNGDELALRGELHGDCIVFRHLCGYQRTLGAWVPVDMAPPAYEPKPRREMSRETRRYHVSYPPAPDPITEDERQALFRSQIAKKLGWG